MGPRTFCFSFFQVPLGFFLFFVFVCFIFLTLNGIPLLHKIAYRLSKLRVSESDIALAKTISVKLLRLTEP